MSHISREVQEFHEFESLYTDAVERDLEAALVAMQVFHLKDMPDHLLDVMQLSRQVVHAGADFYDSLTAATAHELQRWRYSPPVCPVCKTTDCAGAFVMAKTQQAQIFIDFGWVRGNSASMPTMIGHGGIERLIYVGD